MNETQARYEFPSDPGPAFPAEIIPPPNTALIERQVTELQRQAAAISITDQGSLTIANQFSIAVKLLRKEIDGTFDPIIEAAHKAHKLALDKKRKFVEPVDAAEKLVKGKIGDYLAEQDRIRREAERRAWEAEQEKIRVQQEALRAAREAEEKARREAAEAEARASRARSEESRRRAQEEAERIRKEAEAEQQKILEAAAEKESKLVEEQKAAVPPTPAPATKGISTRQDWDFEVMDAAAVPREYLVVDEVKVRQIVRAMKGETNIPGIRVFSKTVVTQRIK